MKGSSIIVSTDPQGVFVEGYVSGTPKPGTVMQKKASTDPVGGRFTYEVYAPGADGKAATVYVLLPDDLQGANYSNAYTTGKACRLYVPAPGEDLNMLVADVSGTGDDHYIGERLMIQNSTGKLITYTGTPDMCSFECNEATTDPTADALLWCTYTGH